MTIEQKFIGLWVKIFRQSCQNCILRVPKDTLIKKNFRKTFNFLPFLHFEKKFLGPLTKIFRLGCQNCSLPIQRYTLSDKSYFWKNFSISFGPWAKKFVVFGKRFPAKLSQLLYTCPWKRFEQNFGLFGEKFSAGLSKLHSTRVHRQNWGKKFSWKVYVFLSILIFRER